MHRLAPVLAVLIASAALLPGAAEAALKPVELASGLEAQALAAGPQGTLWVAGIVDRAEDPVQVFVERLAPSGKRLTFSRPVLPGSIVGDLIRGPQDSMWFTVPKTDEVVGVDATGDFRAVQMPSGSRPTGLVAAAGAIWVTLNGRPEIARIEPADPEPVSFALRPQTFLTRIVLGPDGYLWALTADTAELVRVSPQGEASYVPLTTGTPGFEGLLNSDITVGNDGAFWVSQSERGTVERLKRKGDHLDLAGFPLPGGPAAMLTRGPAGDIWFANGGSRVGSIAPDGEVGERRCATAGCATIRALARAPDGRLWFATRTSVAPFEPRPLALGIRNVDGHARVNDGKLSFFVRLRTYGGAAAQRVHGRLEISYRGRRLQSSAYPLSTGADFETWVPLDRGVRRLLSAQGRVPVVIRAKVGARTSATRGITLSVRG